MFKTIMNIALLLLTVKMEYKILINYIELMWILIIERTNHIMILELDIRSSLILSFKDYSCLVCKCIFKANSIKYKVYEVTMVQ